MCFGRSKKIVVPDTSGQEAELTRQLELLKTEFERNRLQQETFFNTTRADQDARYQDQRAFDLAEAERQRAAMQAQLDAEVASRTTLEARAEAEREAARQQAELRATRARDYATGRQNLIDTASSTVNSAYAGFDDPFFQQFRQAFVSNYQPQVQSAYVDANRKERFNLHRAGILNSSAGAQVLGNLRGQLIGAEGELAKEADDATEEYRNSVAQQRSNTLQGLLASGLVGTENLPDGVTDVGGALDALNQNVSSFTGQVGDSIRALSPSSFLRPPTLSRPQARNFAVPSPRTVTTNGAEGSSSFLRPLTNPTSGQSSFRVGR